MSYEDPLLPESSKMQEQSLYLLKESSCKKLKMEKIDRDRQYARYYDKSVRTRTFQENWKLKYPWVVYDKDNNVMFCKICTNSPLFGDPSSSFVRGGCSNFLLSSLKSHEVSKQHVFAIQSESGTALQTFNVQLPKESAPIGVLMRSAHALVKSGRPYNDYPWICQLDEAKGVDIGCNKAIHTESGCSKLVHCIAEVEKQKLNSLVENSPFFSILYDISVDKFEIAHVIFYLRTFENYLPHTRFLSIEEISAINGRCIHEALKKSFQNQLYLSEEVWLPKLISVMVSSYNSQANKTNELFTYLQQLGYHIIPVNCSAYRLEQSLRCILKSLPIHQKLGAFIWEFNNFYKFPQNKLILKTICNYRGIDFMIPKSDENCSWITNLLDTIRMLTRLYPAIMEHFEKLWQQNAHIRILSLKPLLQDKHCILYIHFLIDVLEILDTTLMELKTSSMFIYNLVDVVEDLQANLSKMSYSPGPNLKHILNSKCFYDIDLSDCKSEEFFNDRKLVLHTLLAKLNSKSQDFERMDIKACAIANLKLWPRQKETLLTYGDEELDKLTVQWENLLKVNGISSSQLPQEWTKLKNCVIKYFSSVPDVSWERVFIAAEDRCQNILKLICLILTLPAHAEDYEKGLTLIDKANSSWQSDLPSHQLTDLVRTVLYAPPMESFDPREALSFWFAGYGDYTDNQDDFSEMQDEYILMDSIKMEPVEDVSDNEDKTALVKKTLFMN